MNQSKNYWDQSMFGTTYSATGSAGGIPATLRTQLVESHTNEVVREEIVTSTSKQQT